MIGIPTDVKTNPVSALNYIYLTVALSSSGSLI